MGNPCLREPTKPMKQGCVINTCYVQLSVTHADMQLIGDCSATVMRGLSAKQTAFAFLVDGLPAGLQ